MQDVASAAGVTRGAVYWHFKDKVDLLWTIADTLFMPHEDLLERLVAEESEEPLLSLLEHCCATVNAIVNDPRRRRVFTVLTQRCEYIEEMEQLMQRNHASRDKVLEKLSVIFAYAEKRGMLASGWTAKVAAVTLHSMVYGFVHMEMEWDKPSRKRDEIRNEAFRSFFKAVSA